MRSRLSPRLQTLRAALPTSVVAVVLTLLLALPSAVEAETKRATVHSTVHLREQPNTTKSKRLLQPGETLEVSSETTNGFHSAKTSQEEQGFVSSKNITVHEPPCAPNLKACTPDGCEQPNTPHALLNNRKRRTTDSRGNQITFAGATAITIADMIALQTSVKNVIPPPKAGQDLTLAQRNALQNLKLKGVALGEGTAVRVAAYVAPSVQNKPAAGAHEGGPESVNCRVATPPNAPSSTVHDFHIPITSKAITATSGVTECNGVVVEMIPQDRDRHPNWSLAKLQETATKKQLVMFVGPLLYDNEHVPNPDCANLVKAQPKRASLWEIHPVVEFYVCGSGNSCKATSLAGWTRVD